MSLTLALPTICLLSILLYATVIHADDWSTAEDYNTMTSQDQGLPTNNVFCYYGSSSHSRPDLGQFLPEHIDPWLCTHVIFAFVDITEDGAGLRPNNQNDLGPDGLYARTVALKQQNPDLKVLLAVGGWRIGSKPFLPIIEGRHAWEGWINNVVDYLRKYDFDGFDMDWEFPGWRGSGPEDKYKFTLFMKDMHDRFAEEAMETGRDRLLLTMATAASAFYAEVAYEQAEIHKHLDFMLLMTYNYHGSGWEHETGHHAPLEPHWTDPHGEQREFHVLWSIRYWLGFGVPRSKLVMGLPMYGLGWKLEDGSVSGVRSPADGGNTPGRWTKESGILAHYEICDHVQQDGWEVQWIEDQKVPYAFGGGEWVGFDSPDSILLKTKAAIKEGLGGVFIWSLEMDDFHGHCGGPTYPLLRTVHQAFSEVTHKDMHHMTSHHVTESMTSQEWSSSSSTSKEWTPDVDSSSSVEDAHYFDEHTACAGLEQGIHPDPASCRHFLACQPANNRYNNATLLGATRMDCPDGTKFDARAKICDFEDKVDC